MITQRTIILGSTGPVFAICSPNESVFGADHRSGPFYPYLKGRCLDNQFCRKIANLPHLLLWPSETKCDIATLMCALTE